MAGAGIYDGAMEQSPLRSKRVTKLGLIVKCLWAQPQRLGSFRKARGTEG